MFVFFRRPLYSLPRINPSVPLLRNAFRFFLGIFQHQLAVSPASSYLQQVRYLFRKRLSDSSILPYLTTPSREALQYPADIEDRDFQGLFFWWIFVYTPSFSHRFHMALMSAPSFSSGSSPNPSPGGTAFRGVPILVPSSVFSAVPSIFFEAGRDLVGTLFLPPKNKL